MTREYYDRQLTLDTLAGLDAHRDFIRLELEAALPAGWTLNRHEHGWRVDLDAAESFPLTHSFVITFSLDTKLIVVLHGNSDAGALTLNHLLQRATAIQLSAHALIPLREAFAEIFRREQPNTYGLT